MPFIFAATFQVRDWQALRKLNNQHIILKAKALQAIGSRIYRNPNDASQAFVWVELLEVDDICEMRNILAEQVDTLTDVQMIDDQVWEPTDLDAISDDHKGGDQPRP